VRFDPLGTLLLVVTLAAYALAMTLGRGRPGWLNLLLGCVAVAGGGLFVRVEALAAAPLIRLAMFRDRALSASLAMSALVSTVMMATLVVGPFYLARALGLDAARVGLVLSSGPLVAALTAVPAGRLTDRLGAGRVTIAGLAGVGVGAALLATLPARLGIAGFLGPIVVVTAGYALFQAANNTAVMTGVRPEQRGVVSGLLNLSRNLGLITGASVLGAVFAAAAGAVDLKNASPEGLESGLHLTFCVATGLSLCALAIALDASRRPPRAEARAPDAERPVDPKLTR
jgi:MFS family permease